MLVKELKSASPTLKKEIVDCLDWATKGKPIRYKLRYFNLYPDGNYKHVLFKNSTFKYNYLFRDSDRSARVYYLGDVIGSEISQNKLFVGTKKLLDDYFSSDGSAQLNYHYSSSSRGIAIDKYPLILERLHGILTKFSSNFSDANKYVFFNEARRFGFKNGMVFFYKGESKTEMRIGKAIKKLSKLCNVDLTDNQVKDIYAIIENSDKPLTVELVTGSDIPKYYSEQYHSRLEPLGTLGASCMRHDHMSSWFHIYKDNCEGMLLLKDGMGGVVGRALIWESNCGTTIMDRIYSTEANYHYFFDYAIAHDIVRKRYQSYQSPSDWIKPDGTEISRYYEISVSDCLRDDYEYFPYMDTFYYYDEYNGILTNNEEPASYTFRSTGGGYDEY